VAGRRSLARLSPAKGTSSSGSSPSIITALAVAADAAVAVAAATEAAIGAAPKGARILFFSCRKKKGTKKKTPSPVLLQMKGREGRAWS
jgi:hypothetical protein